MPAHGTASSSPASRRKACSRSVVPARSRISAPDPRPMSLPRAHEEQLVTAVRLVHDVAGDDDRRARLGQAPKVLPELDTQERVDTHRRLVQEEHGGLVDERAGQREPSPLAAGELHGRRPCPIGQLHEAQRRHDRLPVADAVRRREESRVVGHRERRVDAVALGHVADARQDAPVGHRDAQDSRPLPASPAPDR